MQAERRGPTLPAKALANSKGNLYKFWNRMSSGSYVPPPVRLVEILRDHGGTRPLGIPIR